MSFPVILINSATGSDTAASGCGPSTAITGSNAATNATGLIVTLAGADLSGVTPDMVIYMNNATPNACRYFGKITAVDNIAKTVTVSDAYPANLTGKTFAIGGKRATINGTGSSNLWGTSANAAGDCMPGWTARMESGHVESGSQITCRRAGNLTDGYITVEGESGASVRPVYTTNGNGISYATTYHQVRGFDFKRSGTSGGTAIICNGYNVIENMRILPNVSVKFSTGIQTFTCSTIENNAIIDGTTGVGIDFSTGNGIRIRFNQIKAGTYGLSGSHGTRSPALIEENIIYGCGSGGILYANTNTTDVLIPSVIKKNTIHGNTGAGITFSSTSSQMTIFHQSALESNQITGNTTFGVNFTGSGMTDALLAAVGYRIWNNNFGTGGTANASGISNLTLTLSGANNQSLDPGYIDAANGDFRIGTATKALGYPTGVFGTGIVAGNRSYKDIGALQREEAGGGGIPLIGAEGLVY